MPILGNAIATRPRLSVTVRDEATTSDLLLELPALSATWLQYSVQRDVAGNGMTARKTKKPRYYPGFRKALRLRAILRQTADYSQGESNQIP